MRKRGFTLIELLVVIAIIAILAAILFPVFKQAQDQAKSMVCLNNAKQIGSAMVMYLQDNSSTWPSYQIYVNAYPTLPPAATTYYQMGQHCYGGLPKLLSKQLKTLRVFSCPSDPWHKPFKDGISQTELDGTFTSLVYRGAFLSYTANGKVLKDSALMKPTKQIFLHEFASFHKGMLPAWQPRAAYQGIPTLLVVWADGHAGKFKAHYWGASWPIDMNQFTKCTKASPKYPDDFLDPSTGWDE